MTTPNITNRGAYRIAPTDDVAVALRDFNAGERVLIDDRPVQLREAVARGHKFALRAIAAHTEVRKYGWAIGRATSDIEAGAHVHTHNLATQLEGAGAYKYQPKTFESAPAQMLLNEDARWGICEVALQSAGVRDALAPQDGLYTLVVLDAEIRHQVIGAAREFLVAPESSEHVLQRFIDPATRDRRLESHVIRCRMRNASARNLELHDDRLFAADPSERAVARRLYEQVRSLPIISPHGHTDPSWFAENRPFANATELLLAPDHYLYRMMCSQGIPLDQLGVPSRRGAASVDPREAWRLFAKNFFLFRGTPSALWLGHVFSKVFGFEKVLNESTADDYFDRIGTQLALPDFKPRRLFERFNIELLATTESPIDTLEHHRTIRASGWLGRIVTAYRPDPVVDPEFPGFADALVRFGEITGEDTHSWRGYLNAHCKQRAVFANAGATSTDHGHPTAATADLSDAGADRLFGRVTRGDVSPADAELFRATMLVEMAKMSLDDGLVMQIHPGSFRNHNRWLFDEYGRDKGADIPQPTDYVRALKPLLDRFGNETELGVILFTLDESTYSRELAPLAGHYPILKLGPSWWFHDSPEGMLRFREYTTETAGFYNTVGFNDDTRAFLSIPARYDVARRIDCRYLAQLVVEHRIDEEEAVQVVVDLAYNLPKSAYRL